MDGQDHKKPVTYAVYEVHGVHLCHRCGWPFPNPHPSAKHRRAHKRVCGKIEGYKISPSDLAISDDSDEGDQHTPSPKIEKSNVKESNSDGGVRLRSNKSEDDVFSDAATEFSESGISSSLEECLEVTKGDDKKIEQKSVEGDVNVNLLIKKVDECVVSVEPGNRLQSDDIKYDSPKSVHIQVEGDKLVSASLTSKEEKASDPTLMAVVKKEEPHDELDGSTHVSDTTKFTAVEDKPEMEDVKVPLARKSDTFVPRETSVDDVGSSKEKCSVTAVSIPVFHNSSVPEDDSTARVLEENGNHHDEKANYELPVAGNESGKGSVVEVQAIIDSSKPSVNSTDPLPSGEVDVDPRQLGILSDTDSGLLEFKDVEFMRSHQGFEAGNVTGLDIGLNLDIPDVVGVKSVGVADVVDESNRDDDVVFSEKTKEQPISKDSTNPFSESLVLAENYGTNNSLINDVHKPSESVNVVHEVTEQKHDNSAVVLPENSDSSPLKEQETSFMKEKCLLETDSDKCHATEDFSMAVLVGIVETPDKNSHEDSSNADKKVSDGENATAVDSKSLQDEDYTNDKLINEKDSVSAADSLKVQETSFVKEKCLLETDSDKCHATEDFSMPVLVGIVETPDKNSHEDSSNADKKGSDGENATAVDSKSLQDEDYTNDKLIKEKDSVSAADSLEGKWGSISAVETNSQSSPRSETNIQNSERRHIKVHQSKSDDFDPPSFMTLVQPGKASESVAAPTASEIKSVQHNQQQKSESLQAGRFPSLTNVVNDLQGRKKNEDIIAKVTNWNAGKEHHSQLKNLLNEAKSPNTKQQKDKTSQKDNGAAGTTMSSVVEPEEPKLEIPHKEDWNSPARYPVVIKKEKKKGKPYWVPFVCCSSVNREM